jgi:hypothetical protein
MSGEAIKWVIKNSPYEGGVFTVHLIMAASVDEFTGNKIQLSERTLAQKARCSARTVRRAKAQMLADGFLDLIDGSHGPGKVDQIRLVIPSTEDGQSPEETIINKDSQLGHRQ